MPYIERALAAGVRLHDMTRHLLGLFAGRPGARAYRQTLAMLAPARGARASRCCAKRWRRWRASARRWSV